MKKLISFILALCMIVQPIAGFAETDLCDGAFLDTEGHWARETIEKYHQKGMAKGYPGNIFAPDQKMKRSEMATFINRYFGFTEETEDNFTDVKDSDWFSSETAKAKYYGYIEDMQARPGEAASREDVVRALSLILDLSEQESVEETKEFKDLEGLDAEIQENIEKFSELGYIKGYEDGTFRPKETVSRAEILVIIERALGYIVATQEDADNIPVGVCKITIIRPGITIEGKNISGNIYITAGAKGKTTIRNTKIGGTVEIAGGQVILDGVSVQRIAVTKAKGTPIVSIKGSQIEELDIKTKAQVSLQEGSGIVRASANAETSLSLGEGTKVGSLTANKKTNVAGGGEIERAYIKTDQMTMEEKSGYIRVYSGGKAMVGGRTVTKTNDDYRVSSGGSPSVPPVASEDGTADRPYLIETIEDLAAIGRTSNWDLDKSYKLMNDLDFTSAASYASGEVNPDFLQGTTSGGWVPIGSYTDSLSNNPFAGTFDGNGKTISNLFIDGNKSYQALFGYTSGAAIRDLGLLDANITGIVHVGGIAGYVKGGEIRDSHSTGNIRGIVNVGGLAGYVKEGTIKASYSTGAVNGTEDNAGGIAGFVYGGTIQDAYATADVGGSNNVGGIAGNAYSITIQDSYATGEVSASNNVGGIAGNAYSDTIQGSYATGEVSGVNYIGGIAGNTSSCTIQDSYSTGTVNGTGNNAGGIAGRLYNGTIQDSYATGNVGGALFVGGIAGYIRISTVSACLAFNESIRGSGSDVNRVVGNYTSGTISNNYANSGMLVGGTAASSLDAATLSGADLADMISTGAPPLSSWDFISTWQMESGACRPTLLGVGSDDAVPPAFTTYSAESGDADGEIALSASIDGEGTIYYALVTSGSAALTKEGIKYGTGHAATGSAVAFSEETISGLQAGACYDIYLFGEDEEGNSSSVVCIEGVKAKLDYYGAGTASNPYKIHTIEDLARIGTNELDSEGNEWRVYDAYILMNDLDFEEPSSYGNGVVNTAFTTAGGGEGWIPIGGAGVFWGSFDGNGKTISHLYINRPAEANQGLFGYISSSNFVDLGIEHSCIAGNYDVGGLAGYAHDSDIKGCHFAGTVDAALYRAGGLIGSIGTCSTISDSWTNASVEAEGFAGGFAGSVSGATVKRCHSSGSVSTAGDKAGGFAGYSYNSTISENYSSCDVSSGGKYAGGLIGHSGNAHTVSNCYALGDVTILGSNNYAGGLIGFSKAKVSGCYAIGDVSAASSDYVGGLIGSTDVGNSNTYISDSIAFNSSITGKDFSTNRVCGIAGEANGAGFYLQLSGNYANQDMLVNGAKQPGLDPASRIGADIASISSIEALAPFDWDFDESDEDENLAYWKIEDEMQRPVLYTDPDGDGSFEKMGTDDGMID